MNTPKIAKWTGVEIKSWSYVVRDIVKEILQVLCNGEESKGPDYDNGDGGDKNQLEEKQEEEEGK